MSPHPTRPLPAQSSSLRQFGRVGGDPVTTQDGDANRMLSTPVNKTQFKLPGFLKYSCKVARSEGPAPSMCQW